MTSMRSAFRGPAHQLAVRMRRAPGLAVAVSPSTGGPHCRLFSVSSSIASLFPFVVLPLALLGLRRLFENIK